MLADPQSITIAGTTISLPRTGVAPSYADYSAPDGATSVRVSQSQSKNQRRTSVALRVNKIAADPLTAVNQRVTSTTSVNINVPVDGFTIQELTDQLVGLATLLTASSAAIAKKVLGGEK